MRNLILYDRYSTHTNAVYEHLNSFARFSTHEHHFSHCGAGADNIDWRAYDAVIVHYSARLVTGAVSDAILARLADFTGGKVLFVQDEYDLTERLRENICRLGFQLVFTCIPDDSIQFIYPAHRFPNTTFVSNLTGYAPLPADRTAWIPLEDRVRWVGYRGRALPFWYGDLGQEKQRIAEQFRAACQERSIPHDIEWDDEHRIYGDNWTQFQASSRATLGTESGSNLFDDHGELRLRFGRYLRNHPTATYKEARLAVVGDQPEKPIMNQVSPRVFEAINAGTALILHEGTYSGVVQPDVHFISLKKDFSNVEDVVRRLSDDQGIAAMLQRAWDDVIGSGRWSYQTFIASYDRELAATFGGASPRRAPKSSGAVTPLPIRAENVRLPRGIAALWRAMPLPFRNSIYPVAHAGMSTLQKAIGRLRR